MHRRFSGPNRSLRLLGATAALLALCAFVAVQGTAAKGAVTAHLVEDILPGIDTVKGHGHVPLSSQPFQFFDLGGVGYFVAQDRPHGQELWRTNGTTAGTKLVKDIDPGKGSSAPYAMIKVGSTLYFTADDGVHGTELWRSDGSAGGTTMVKDINPGPGGIGGGAPPEIDNVDGTLYFHANDGTHGVELWRSDGTAAGTTMVKDINPGPGDSTPVYMTGAGGTVYFEADDGTHGTELWRSDGTEGGDEHGQGHRTPSGGKLLSELPRGLRRSGLLFRQRQHSRPRVLAQRRHRGRHDHPQGHRPRQR